MGPKRNSDSIYHRGPIQERGMEFQVEDGNFDEVICQLVNYHGWHTFVQSPGDFYYDWVLDFYSNLEKGSDSSMVRGIRIDCSAEKINHLFDLDNVDDQVTNNFIENPIWADIEGDTNIFPFGINWTPDGHGERQSLLVRNVGYVASAILAFLSTRLIPSAHKHFVYVPRIVLLYVIFNRMTINVGRIINAGFEACKFDPTVRSIFFPSTIILLVKDAGVKRTKNLYNTLSNSMITKTFWKKLEKTDGPKRKKGEEERPRQERKTRLVVQQTDMMRQMSQHMETLLKNVGQLSGRFDKVEERLRSIEIVTEHSFSRQNKNHMQDNVGFVNFPGYAPVPWENPATNPISEFCSVFDFMDQQPQLNPAPPIASPMMIVVPDPIPTHNRNLFYDFSDWDNISLAQGDLSTLFAPPNKVKGVTIQESARPSKKAKTQEDEVGKGKDKITEEPIASDSDDEEGMDLTLADCSQRKEKDGE